MLPTMTVFGDRLHARRLAAGEEGGADRNLAGTAGDVEDIGRLAQAGKVSAQAFDQRLPLFQRQTEMRGTRREIGMMPLIGRE